MDKKGDGEQFNWIFVIIAGSIILGFFVLFVFKFVELQEKRHDVKAVRFLGESVIGASSKLQVGSGGAAIDSNEDEGLRFGFYTNLEHFCRSNKSLLTINSNPDVFYKLDDEVVFMNKEMNSVNAIDIWILPWNFPFHVTNLVYLADPKTNFYFVVDGNSREFVENLDFSSAFDFEIINNNELNKVKDNSKVVFFKSNEPSVNEVKSIKKNYKDIHFVYINLNSLKAKFFDNQRESWSEGVKFYITEDNKGMLYGAIFSNDADNFECNVNRALERVVFVSKVYSERARYLSHVDRRQGCDYGLLLNGLNKLNEWDGSSDLN